MVLAQGFILFLEMLKFSKKSFSQRNLFFWFFFLKFKLFIYLFIYLFLSDEDNLWRIFWNILVLEMEFWKLINYLWADMC